MTKTKAFSTIGMSDMYMTTVATRHKISDDVIKILPGILDSLEEMLDNKDCTNRRDNQYYVSQMFRSATEAQAWHQLPGTTDANTHNVVVNGLTALLRRPVSSPRVFKSPTGIKVNAEQVDESEGKDVGIVHADKGDWIVTNSDITGLVYSDDEFRMLFTLDEDESA